MASNELDHNLVVASDAPRMAWVRSAAEVVNMLGAPGR